MAFVLHEPTQQKILHLVGLLLTSAAVAWPLITYCKAPFTTEKWTIRGAIPAGIFIALRFDKFRIWMRDVMSQPPQTEIEDLGPPSKKEEKRGKKGRHKK